MARPRGQFDKKKYECLQLLKELAGLGTTNVSDKFLADRLDRTRGSVQLYINALKNENRIHVTTGKLLKGANGKCFRNREISIVTQEPATKPVTQDEVSNLILLVLAKQIEVDNAKREADLRFAANFFKPEIDPVEALREIEARFAEEAKVE